MTDIGSCPYCGVSQSATKLEQDQRSVYSGCNDCSSLMSTHSIPLSTPVVVLDASEAFNLLTDREKLYAYWMGQASWKGSLTCLSQCSPESVAIFTLLLAVFSAQPVEELLNNAISNGFNQNEIDEILMYSAAFLSNMGNYKSFGDTKFVPQVAKERFRQFLLASNLESAVVNSLFDCVQTRMYSLYPRHRQVSESFC